MGIKQPGFRHPVGSLLAAIRFLTILPLPGSGEEDERFFEGALLYFTITGLLIGIQGALIGLVLTELLPVLVTAVLLTLYLSLISGFLHLDGLADSSDGMLSSRPADKCLEIMRDSRIGVMGGAAICSLLLLKTAAFASLDSRYLFDAMVLAPAAGRTSIILMMALAPYARSDGGLGQLFYSESKWTAVLVSLLLLGAAILLLVPQKLLLLMTTLAATTLIFTWICRKRIGGATGDTLGALCELTETLILVSFCIHL